MKKEEMLLAQNACVTFCQYCRKTEEGQPAQPLHWGAQMWCSITTQMTSQGLLETTDSVGHFHLIWVSSKSAAI